MFSNFEETGRFSDQVNMKSIFSFPVLSTTKHTISMIVNPVFSKLIKGFNSILKNQIEKPHKIVAK